ncbi:MAG: hypothetical protein IJ507_06475 [Clostridia bacterium]|nr:hypothetical protein [Clostridia bacterium]
MSKLSGLRHAVWHQLKFVLVVLLGYLCQVCVMPYAQFGGVTPSLIYTVIAIITVGYDRHRTLWVSGFYGIVLETMLPGLPMLNLLMYPIGAMFCSIIFADKSEKRLEAERSIGRPPLRSRDFRALLEAMHDRIFGAPGQNANPYIRTPLCAAVNVLIYEVVNLVYIYLGGTIPMGDHYSRAFTNILTTTLLAILLMYPVRHFLGFRKPVEEKRPPVRY